MAAKTANGIAGAEPDVKKRAESLLKDIGIPSSAVINMFYRQITADNGLPFRPTGSINAPKAQNELTGEECNVRMAEKTNAIFTWRNAVLQ